MSGFLPNPNSGKNPEWGDESQLSPDAQAALGKLKSLVQEAHNVMKTMITEGDASAARKSEKLTKMIIDMGVTNKDDVSTIMSLIMVAATSISPTIYGGSIEDFGI